MTVQYRVRNLRIAHRCSHCHGWGFRYHGPDSAPCDVCHGSGRKQASPPWECGACDGDGLIDIGVDTIVCPNCSGRGDLLPEPVEPELVSP